MEELTKREKQALDLVLSGKKTCEIKQELQIATSTVRTYYKHLFQKLFVKSKHELILKYKKQGNNNGR